MALSPADKDAMDRFDPTGKAARLMEQAYEDGSDTCMEELGRYITDLSARRHVSANLLTTQGNVDSATAADSGSAQDSTTSQS